VTECGTDGNGERHHERGARVERATRIVVVVVGCNRRALGAGVGAGAADFDSYRTPGDGNDAAMTRKMPAADVLLSASVLRSECLLDRRAKTQEKKKITKKNKKKK